MGDVKEQNRAPSLIGWQSWPFWIWTVDIFIRGKVDKGKSSILKHKHGLLSNGEEYWLVKGRGKQEFLST